MTRDSAMRQPGTGTPTTEKLGMGKTAAAVGTTTRKTAGGSLALLLLLMGCSGAPEPNDGRRNDRGATLPAAVPGSSSGSSESAREPTTEPNRDAPPPAATEIAPTPAPTRPPSAGDPESPETAKARAEDAGDPSDPLVRRAADDDTLIIIDQRAAPRTASLAEAARKAREERGKAPRPKIVITDDNLADYATGDLTVAAPGATSVSEGESAEEPVGEDVDEDLGRNEEHWRQGARELRLKLRRAWDEARLLAEQVAGLRVRFYAEDDPHVRDAEIKPAWDRALERQRQAEEEVRAYRRELDRFLEEGRRAGALPGWLREGIEHEPELPDEEREGTENEEALDGFGRLKPVEPERMKDSGRPPG